MFKRLLVARMAFSKNGAIETASANLQPLPASVCTDAEDMHRR